MKGLARKVVLAQLHSDPSRSHLAHLGRAEKRLGGNPQEPMPSFQGHPNVKAPELIVPLEEGGP